MKDLKFLIKIKESGKHLTDLFKIVRMTLYRQRKQIGYKGVILTITLK